MGGGSEETVDFVPSEDVTRPTALSCAAEKVGWRHLVTIVFRVQCTRQTADGEQSIMALADRRRTCCPLQDRVRLDKLWLWLKFGASGDRFFSISHSVSKTYWLSRAGPTRGPSSAVVRYLHPT